MSDPSDPNSYTVGWVCALSTEFTAAQEQFDEEFEPHESPEHREANDFNVYSFGKIKGHMVVVAVLPNGQYGTTSAATVAKDMIRSFRNIRFGLMVGIGGGAPTKDHDIRLDDVVVSSPTPSQGGVFQYDLGKATEDGFQHTASHNKPPPLLLAAVAGLKTQYERKGLQTHDKTSTIISNNKRLRAKYGRPEDPDSLFAASVKHKGHPCHELCVTTPNDLISRTPRQEPMEVVEVHYGTIASGNTLMKDATKRDELASKENILCFEMEAAGLMDGFRCLIIRGVCDYCDSHKNDKWQGYAAMAAAVYAKQILGMIRPETVAREETLVSKIDEVISGVQDLKRSITEQEVLEWISDEDFGNYQLDERSKKTPGTCEWFLDSLEYQSWTQEKGQVLFCPGIAGAGKTVLASAIIEDLHSRFETDSSTVTVHIYCRYNRVDRQSFNKLRASVLRQLCERLSPLPDSIMQLYSQYKPRRVGAPPEKIQSELESLSNLFSRIFMVVDALDEWATENGDLYSLPAELLRLQRRLATNLLVTSRPIPLIANQFKNYHSISITAQQQDIHAYVDNFPWPESSCIGKIQGLRGLIKRVMSETVKGMFLLARLYLHSLENETSERDVKDALKQFEDRAKNNDNDPKFNIVDQAYNDTLQRLRQQHQNSSDLAFRVLAWICCTGWKLPADTIQHGLALREGDSTFHEDGMIDKQLLLSVCCGLVEIADGSREIQLAHYTAESFFRHNRHLLDDYFRARHLNDGLLPSNADAYLARQCATCLSIGLPRYRPGGGNNEPQLGRFYDMFNTATNELYDDPLYMYSAFGWGGHVRRLTPSSQEYKTSIEFLQKRGIVDRAAEAALVLGVEGETRDIPLNIGNLHLAVLFGLEDLAESLIKKHDINSRDSCGRTVLVWALQCLVFGFTIKPKITTLVIQNLEIYDGIDIAYRRIVKALLRSGANPHVPGYNGDLPLHLAAGSGDAEIVKLLLENHSNVDQQDQKGDTALMKACIGDHAEVIDLLFAANARLDIKNGAGETAIYHGGKYCGEKSIKRLLRHSKDSATRYEHSGTALISASQSQRPETVSLILEDAELKPTSKYIDFALSESCSRSNGKVVRLLIDHGANPNLPLDKRRHFSVLSGAITSGDDDVVLTLLDAGINVEGNDEEKERPIHYAAFQGTKTMVQNLIDRGVSVNLRSGPGMLPLDYAMRREDGDTPIAVLLRKHGAISERERLVQLMRDRSKRFN